jgi:hypothetical protein
VPHKRTGDLPGWACASSIAFSFLEATMKIKAQNNEIMEALKACASFVFLLVIVAGGLVRLLTAVPQ